MKFLAIALVVGVFLVGLGSAVGSPGGADVEDLLWVSGITILVGIVVPGLVVFVNWIENG